MRLVVFVHGFRGKPVSSWQQFPAGCAYDAWWCQSDLLFVGYRSTRDDITGVADRLRVGLARFYPCLDPDLVQPQGTRLREPHETPYRELVLVGHSLGGVIIRRCLCEVAERWRRARLSDDAAPAPALLDAKVRLFSPASAGFRAAGPLGMLRATSKWGALEMFLRRSSAYSDLQPGCDTLKNLRAQTENLIGEAGSSLDALRACILWANPDEVVLAERYATDHPHNVADGKGHRAVCKPDERWPIPWMFTRLGDLG